VGCGGVIMFVVSMGYLIWYRVALGWLICQKIQSSLAGGGGVIILLFALGITE
jgi:hypothetical protein